MAEAAIQTAEVYECLKAGGASECICACACCATR